VKIELQAPEAGRDEAADIMKSFGGETRAAPSGEPEKAAEPEKSGEADDLMKAFGAPPAKK